MSRFSRLLVPVLFLAGCAATPVVPIHELDFGDWDLNELLLYRYWAMGESAWRVREQFRESPWDLDYFGAPETGTLAVAIDYDNTYHIAFRATFTDPDSPDRRLNYRALKRRPAYHDRSSEFRAHSGYLSRYESVRGQLLERAFTNRDRTIVIIGVSAGGALATLAFGDIRTVAPDIDIRLITYAAPRVLSRATTRALRHEEHRTARVVHANDIVPSLPPRVFGYRHLGKQIQVGRPRRSMALASADHHPGYRDTLRAMLQEAGIDRDKLGY